MALFPNIGAKLLGGTARAIGRFAGLRPKVQEKVGGTGGWNQQLQAMHKMASSGNLNPQSPLVSQRMTGQPTNIPMKPKTPPNPATLGVKPPITLPAPKAPQTGAYGQSDPFQTRLDPTDPAAIGGSMMNVPRAGSENAVSVGKTQLELATENAPKLPPQPVGKSALEIAQENYLKSLEPSSDVSSAEAQIRALEAQTAQARQKAESEYAQRIGAIQEQATLQPFLTGRQVQAGEQLSNQLAALRSGSEAQAIPLSQRLAEYQARQEAQRQRAEAELGFRRFDVEMAEAKRKEEAAGRRPIEIGGRLIDPTTGKVLFEPKEKPLGPIEVSEGASLFDPVTGKQIFTAPKTYKATGGTGGAGGGTGGGALSSLAQSVFDNPGLLNTLTPTVKGKVLGELAASGKDVSRFGLQNLGATQREQVSLFDEIENEANFAKGLYDKGVNTGPVAGRLGVLGQAIGTTGSDFTNLNSAISNMGSILLRMRSGAAVTPQEFERIRGFIPSINEDEGTAKEKIDRFYEAINSAKENYIARQTQSTYSMVNQPREGFGATGGSEDPLGIR